MKVRAKHNFNTGSEYRRGGEVFEVESLDGIKGFVEEIGFKSAIFPPEEKEPVKRTRKKKTE